MSPKGVPFGATGISPNDVDDAAAARFWAKVNKYGPTQPHMEAPCWEWTACKAPNGYPAMALSSARRLATHVAVVLDGRSISPGQVVLHRCDNRCCVRPDHLSVGTQRDNLYDAVSKGRLRFGMGTHKNRGQNNASAKLTVAQVIEIRAHYDSSRVSQRQLAKKYGVSSTTISDIGKRLSWTNIPEMP